MSPRVWPTISGPLLAAGAAAAIEVLSRGGFGIPNPPAFLLLIVVFSAFLGGLGSGLVTALIAWVSFLYFFSTPGDPFHYTSENLIRVIVWGVTTPVMAMMVGVLKRRTERGVASYTSEQVSAQVSAALAEQAAGRRRAEWVLQESEARYRTLFESVPVGLVRTTPAGQILDANAAMVRILGYPDRETLLATNMRDIYFDPKEREWRAAQVARQGSVANFEAYQMRRYDRTPVWVETSGQATYDSEGRVLYFDGVIMDVTDRKREEETRKRWAAIIESTDDAIIGEDLEFKIQSWNVGAEKIYGYAAAEVIGRSISLLAPPDRVDEIPGFIERLKRGERLQNIHTVRARKDGSLVDVALTISPIKDAAGNFVGTSTVARDITAYKRNEEARNLLAALVESSDDAILGTDREGVIQSWNAGAERIYGYAVAEVLGRSASFLAPPDRPHEIPGLLARVGRGERIERLETVRVRKDGARIDVSLTVSPIKDAAGTVIGVSSIARDVSARKRSEKALRESEGRYRGLFQGMPVGLYRASVEGEILEANPAFLKMLGCPSLETLRALGARGLYVDPEARQRWLEALEKQGVVSGFESQLRRLDGSVIWVAASARIVHDPTGASYLEGAVEDITERKQVQEAILRARESDRANQAKSEFLSRMSHELRTPLNAILGFGQLLELDSISPKQHEYVEDILKGGRHLLELINEVLDIARIEAGRLTFSSEPVSVREIVQESLALITPLSSQENIRVEDGTAGIVEQFVLADRQRLKQVLLNLLSNAVKYNRKGGLVAVSCESTPGGRLRIKVSDTGAGISPDALEHLFVPFERLGAEDTAIEGTGLGLALSKRLVEAMGGTMGVDSVVGRGTTFWVDLAVAESPRQELRRTDRPGEAGLQAPPTAGAVLYIEDNLSNLKLVQNLLALRSEVKLIPAMQGRLGLDLARQHHPDLILLDVHLPDMPGSEVLRRLQAAPETRDIPVVVISADATRSQIDRLLAAGARAYLTKPFDVKKLLAVLDETLSPKGTRDDA